MKRNYPRTYRSRRPLKIILTALVTLLIAAIILTLSLFFGLRQYIVYDPGGTLHLEIPWLQDDSGE
ncbi:hypothetical protein SAMN02745823_03216 [Sporobacter termitidis DSM 10068]|uniref:Uncharacterized protein n=1 Tax=Sporobacter termitidis DSM 10068 TaxID=1123282 RepID=A0A1M5Z4T2_9FIRM|nr:hypothetical protein [Sporobacter termitidis]SHI19144.1 hypothetical protein SAMN02745823_03216 [Sporobacter termitidis DSM 10068]